MIEMNNLERLNSLIKHPIEVICNIRENISIR